MVGPSQGSFHPVAGKHAAEINIGLHSWQAFFKTTIHMIHACNSGRGSSTHK
jgi:hypothetical protein